MTGPSRGARRHTTAAVAAAILAAGTMLLGATAGLADYPTVNGAGSTWVQIALDQWRADIARQGFLINYEGVGSSTGRSFYINNQVDFAASEIPFQPPEVAQLQGEHKAYQYMPDVAGGTSLMYNLHDPAGNRITDLKLDATTAGKIFTGGITSWQDPAIRALNPGLTIADTRITPVIRSDGSGTSAQFSLYLANQVPSIWNPFVSQYGCPAPCSNWPAFPGSTAQNGSDGVANFVANDSIGQGSIGYVEAGYAFARAFPIAWLRNASGHFIPGANDPYVFSASVATALKHATLNADLTQNLTGVYNAPEANAYPMSSYSYLITPCASSAVPTCAMGTNFSPAKGFVLGTWLIYIACAGQKEATPLGYSPLPPNLVSAMFGAEQRIPGAPAPPPIDAAHCPNPTITNPGSLTSTGGSHGSGGGSSSSHGSSTGATTSSTTSTSSGATTQAVTGQSAAGGLSSAFGSGAGAGATAVPTMSAAQRAASFVLAEQAASHALVQPGTPLLLAALGVVALVLVPAFVLRRRHDG